jgi:signal transduction histidine kinase
VAALPLVALTVVFLAAAWPAGAAQSPALPVLRQVLLLQSFDRGSLVIDSFTGNFRVDLDDRVGSPVNVVQIVVGPTGFVGAAEQDVVAYIRSTYAGRAGPDLIVTLAGPAAVFARKHRAQLFPDVPLLFAAVDHRYLRNAPLGVLEAAVAVTNHFPGVIEDIRQALPETTQVFMITGAGPTGQFWRRELEVDLKQFDDMTFLWSSEMSLAEILRRCATLPPRSAIFYINFGTDALGGAYADERVLADLHATANAPIFSLHTTALGHGIVGGRLMSIPELSRNTADVSARILNGQSPRSTDSAPFQVRQALFDWRELQRWRIPESRLPSGSVVSFRRPTLWEEYRLTVVGAAAALVVQALLIAGLLYQRRERQRAEIESRRNLALAADVSRRETMAALTNSISHELGQPLSSMLSNAHALQVMIDARQAVPETIGEILADIRAQGVQATAIVERHRAMLGTRPLERTPVDLRAVINQSLALVGHELRTRQIAVNNELSYTPCIVIGDQVLLQQVLVNLLTNAMDAMDDTPPARRRLTIRTEIKVAEIEVSVRDNGIGLPADSALFAPFVTTKSQGLGIGLTIAQTIVTAYGGTISAGNNPRGGATFTVTLPRGEVAAVPVGGA